MHSFLVDFVLVPCGAEGLSLELAVLVLHVEHGPPDHQLQAQLEGGSDQPLVVGESIDILLAPNLEHHTLQ